MTAPLHVAYLVRYLPSPSETFVLDEARALQAIGVRVSIWALDRVGGAIGHARFRALTDAARTTPRSSRPAAWVASLFLPGGPLLRNIRAHWAEHGRPRDFRRVAWLCGEWSKAGVDVVRIHHAAETARFGVAAAGLAGVPVSVAVHARDLFVPEQDLPWILHRAAHVSTITPFHRERILRIGLLPERVQLLPCAVDLPPRAAGEPAGGVLRVLTVGRLVRKKGHALLLDACAHLAGEGRRVHLTLIGDGGEGARLRGRIHRLQRTHPSLSVDAPGARPSEEVFGHLLDGGYHGCALAGRVADDGDRDGLPVSLLEAAAAGVPIVTTALPGFESEFVQGEGVHLVSPGPDGAPDVEALADALRTVHDAGPEAWRAMSSAVRSAAARRASPEEAARRLLRRLEPLRHVTSGAPAAESRGGEGDA